MPIRGVFHVSGWRGMALKHETQKTHPKWHVFRVSCWWRVENFPNTKNTLIRVCSSWFGRRGWGGGGAETRNPKNVPFWTRSSGFIMVGAWRTSQTRRTHPYRCVLHGWQEGMGVEVLGGREDVSRHEKKEKKGGRTLYTLPVAFLCPFGPSWPPSCVLSCPSRF